MQKITIDQVDQIPLWKKLYDNPGSTWMHNKPNIDSDVTGEEPRWRALYNHPGCSWKLNTKIKTATCRMCWTKICGKMYSYVCSECFRHICSNCLENKDSSPIQARYVSQDQLIRGCYHIYHGFCPPYFVDEVYALQGGQDIAPRRDSLFARDKGIKRDQKAKKEEREARAATELAGQAAASKSESVARSSSRSLSPGESQRGAESGDDVFGPSIAAGRVPRGGTNRVNYRESSSKPAKPLPGGKILKLKVRDRNARQVNERAQRMDDIDGPSTKTREVDEGISATPDTTSNTTTRAPSPQGPVHLAGGATVIVGAGFVGLSIALELAKQTRLAGVDHAITVIDVRGSYCDLASSSCSGLISTYTLPDLMSPIAKLALQCWKQLTESAEFQTTTNFRLHTGLVVEKGGIPSLEARPSWYTGDGTETFTDSKEVYGKLDAQKLADWLYDECKEHGVCFNFDRRLGSVAGTDLQDVEVVTLEHPTDYQVPKERLVCQNVVIASGPWSTGILETTQMITNLEIDNHARFIEWIRVRQEDMTAVEDVGLILIDLAEKESTLQNDVIMTARISDGTIQVTCPRDNFANAAMYQIDALEPEPGVGRPMRRLQRLAKTVLNGEDTDMFTELNLVRGQDATSTSAGGLPIIDKIPHSVLRKVGISDRDERPCGVWLCFGFGMHGTTLAPGVARMLCQRMLTGQSEVDYYDFSIPAL